MAVATALKAEGVDVPEMPETQPLFMEDPIEFLNNMKGPRVIKTHMPLCMLNPKLLDVCKGEHEIIHLKCVQNLNPILFD